MNQQAYQEITKMLNAFPQQASADIRGLLLTYDEDTTGILDQAIIEAAQRFRQGLVSGQNKSFAPASPEFIEEARRRQEFIELKARPRIAPPAYVRGPLAPFEIARQKAFTTYGHLPVLLENVSYDEWRRLSTTKQVPTGAIWVAALGIVYGPEPARKAA